MPSNNPEVIVYIAIDNAKGVTQYGGTVHALLSEKRNKPFIYKGLRQYWNTFDIQK